MKKLVLSLQGEKIIENKIKTTLSMNASLLNRLTNQYQHVIDLVTPYDDSFLIKHHRPEKWSISDNLAHLGRYQEIFEERINQILSSSKPDFGRYKAEDDEVFNDWLNLAVSTIISKTSQRREQLTASLQQLDAAALSKSGRHPKLGLLTITEWTAFFLLHESHHIYTMFWMVKEFRNN